MIPLLETRDVVAGYVPGLPIVRGVSLHVAAGEVVTVIGPNGAGKSTLLKAIAGLVAVSGGRVQLRERDITGLPTHELIAIGIGYVPQTANVFTTLSVHDNLRVGGYRLPAAVRAGRLEAVYAWFPDLAARRREPGRVLSGGQRQLLAIGRALVSEPAVLLLDEATAGLAPGAAAAIFTRVRELARRGVAVLMVEQNARAALAAADRGYVLADGAARLHGPTRALLDDPALADIYLGRRRGAPAGP